MNHIFEVLMLVAFGAAWPFSIRRSWMSRSTAGKSIVFLWVVLIGYACGVINKIVNQQVSEGVVWVYAANALMVSLDTVLYYRNQILEKRVDLGNVSDSE
jgi:hypothetical protein